MFPVLPQAIRDVLVCIQQAGGRGYVVGGALRDLMLGRTVADWDLAATLPQEDLLRVFPKAKNIGGSFGTISFPVAGGICEVTPCREESQYSDRRHPDNVKFTPNILTDLARRDFTVNAMAFDGEILLDPFGGQNDLEKGRLKCVGRPEDRFSEDPLRILRLFRFAAVLGFTGEWETFDTACKMAKDVETVSCGRVRSEVQAILMSGGPQVLGTLINRGALVKYGLHFAPSLASIANVPPTALCRWWTLCALCGADLHVLGEAFGFSQRMVADMEEMTRLYRLGPSGDRVGLKQKLSSTRLDYTPVSAVFAAVSPLFVAEPVLLATILLKGEPYRVQDLAVDGEMLVGEGIRGENCGLVLEELLAAVIKNPALNVKPVLLGLARGLRHLL